MHCGGSKSRCGCCGQPGPWRSTVSTLMPSCSSCLNTSRWEFASPVASLYGCGLVSLTPFCRQWWESAGCSVSASQLSTRFIVQEWKVFLIWSQLDNFSFSEGIRTTTLLCHKKLWVTLQSLFPKSLLRLLWSQTHYHFAKESLSTLSIFITSLSFLHDCALPPNSVRSN